MSCFFLFSFPKKDSELHFYINLKNGSDDVEFIVIEVKNDESLSKNVREMTEQDKNKKEKYEQCDEEGFDRSFAESFKIKPILSQV